jgi:hypothetical protein
MHSPVGQEGGPLEHTLQATPTGTGQSLESVHMGWGHGGASLHGVSGAGEGVGAGGHDGQLTPHTWCSQVAVGHELEPSLHRRHAAPSGAAQSLARSHPAAGHTGAVSEHCPLVHDTA